MVCGDGRGSHSDSKWYAVDHWMAWFRHRVILGRFCFILMFLPARPWPHRVFPVWAWPQCGVFGWWVVIELASTIFVLSEGLAVASLGWLMVSAPRGLTGAGALFRAPVSGALAPP